MLNRFTTALVILVASLARPSFAQGGNLIPGQIVTTGTGEVRVSPDRATIFIGVQSRAATAAAAGSDNARRQKAVIDTLKALGLASDQLTTMNYTMSPEMQYNQTAGTSRVVGYVVTNTVRADVRRIEDVGRLIDAALARGANEISSLQFTSSKADSARRSALAAAVADARADADALAKAVGGSLGPMVEVSTASMPIRPMGVEMRGDLLRSAAQTPIEPGQQTINATVTTRWLFVNR